MREPNDKSHIKEIKSNPALLNITRFRLSVSMYFNKQQNPAVRKQDVYPTRSILFSRNWLLQEIMYW